jgi:DNA-binding response OmpR family regulator
MAPRTMNLLLVEDNRDLARTIVEYFGARGHQVDLAWDGISGLHLAASNSYDVLILDWMLPGLDGLTLCRRLREAGRQVPVLMLTARDSLDDKIAGLQAGADDYVVKPFAMREVEARLQALMRRALAREGSPVLRVGDLALNPETLKVTRGSRAVELPPIALRILEALMRCSPRVLRREELAREIWGDCAPDSDALRAHFHLLRHAIDTAADKPLLKTVRGIGYRISDE